MPVSNEFGKAKSGMFNQFAPGLETPEQIGSVVVFLTSDDANYINGQEITVDGGWMPTL